MACGDKYRHLVVTSDGYTLDNPFGTVGIYPYDYIQWRDLARKLVDLSLAHYAALGDYETTLGSFPKWNALRQTRDAAVNGLDDLPSIVLTGWTGEAAISQAQEVIGQALCLLDLSDQGLAEYRQIPPPIPGLIPKARPGRDDEAMPAWVWVLLGGGATLAVGSYVWAKRRKRREPPPAKIYPPRAGPVARRPEGSV